MTHRVVVVGATGHIGRRAWPAVPGLDAALRDLLAQRDDAPLAR
jgi:hypothetical protein